jgi:hypothetical protein
MEPRKTLAVADEAGRIVAGVRRGVGALLRRSSDTEEPTAAELWRDVSPKLEKALAVYDRLESRDLPESSPLPWRTTQRVRVPGRGGNSVSC